jgi:hypothetical protein
MNKKFMHNFDSYRDEKKAIKEGMSIYEFEDETQDESVADLDSETPAPDEVSVEEAPVEEAPVEATPEEALDFGDGGTISQETAKSELDFISGIVSQYTKLAKNDFKLDDSMKAKIRRAFEIFK